MRIQARRAVIAAALFVALAAAACDSNRASNAPTTPRPGTSQPAATAGPDATGPVSTPQVATAPPQLGRIAMTLEPFATVPGGPLAMTAPDDGTGRLIVAAQDGRIWAVAADGSVGSEPMVDLGSHIRSGGEQGLLGLAAHPTFPTDPRIFVNYTNQAGDTLVASLALAEGEPDQFDLDTHREILFVTQPFANHNGGGVLFGPDGFLYLTLGDGGSGGDPQGNGQRRDTLLGKILRIDVDHAPDPETGGYVTPASNPFANGGGLPEIWHWGLRNPWRLSFDRETGDLWIGDVGQNRFEEIDVARAGAGGLNYGWNVMEGSHCFNDDSCSTDGLTLPVSDYGRDLGCTVIGGYVYRGSRYPFLVGTYLFADYCSGRLFALDAASNALVAPVEVGNGGGQISAFGEDTDGELYVMRLGGELSKVVATER